MLDLTSFVRPYQQKFQIANWGVVDELAPSSFSHYSDWVKNGHSKPLSYLSDERMAKRAHINHVFPEAKQILVFAFDYSQKKKDLENIRKDKSYNGLNLAGHVIAYPKDYHEYLKECLEMIAVDIKNEFSNLKYKIAIDIFPILERDFAYQAGLGWFGKNSMLIDRNIGSYFMIASIIIDQKIFKANEIKETDHCGSCLLCVNACPTDAIDPETRTLKTEQCISTFTIEIFKDVPAPNGMEKAQGEIFGCDICQDVCPWNSKRLDKLVESPILDHPFVSFFLLRPIDVIIADLSNASLKGIKKMFYKTQLERSGKWGILKNLKFWKNQSSNSSR